MTDGILHAPRRLEKGDDRSQFASGADELDSWFQRFSLENQQANNAVTYVTVRDGVVLGYYAIAMSAYTTARLPERLQKNRPVETPCILLARLAVDLTAQGQGVGAGLLRHAMEQAFKLSQGVGAAALLIHCRDDAAKAFYLANGDFLESPVEPTHLILSMKEIRRRVAG
ncbi:N-acetyltransferase (plasmid) [Cellulomonas sp. WB94]|uniref:GNAT family N-acetyltransferase n=1 Tax=Cellulomonas sp. WB94 TaxID=2173174 RepID=UPI000D568496|nr:GNAT family N-acetyltransferase [Cellulomonas sp. WB94]PVU84429.1 N-acetyltransferase [Cellulomonas sp. WB94]